MSMCKVSVLVREVLIAIDENVDSDSLRIAGDSDQLQLSDIVRAQLIPAATEVLRVAPLSLVGRDASSFGSGSSIRWHSTEGVGYGTLSLPDDFLRLVVFRMSDWAYGVNHAIDETSPIYPRQFSKYGGIRGNPERPIVAIVPQGGEMVLQFFSCRGGASLVDARYIKRPCIVGEGKNEELSILPSVHKEIIHYAGYLSLVKLGEIERANALRAVLSEFLKKSDI